MTTIVGVVLLIYGVMVAMNDQGSLFLTVL